MLGDVPLAPATVDTVPAPVDGYAASPPAVNCESETGHEEVVEETQPVFPDDD